MPKNLKEELIFTLVLAGLMVFGMTSYNVVLSQGFSLNSINEIFTGYPLGLFVALLCDFVIVGPIAKKIAFRMLIPKYMKKTATKIALTISLLMVAGMVSCMSLFGVLINNQNLLSYPTTWILNIIVALPLQLLIVGPISRFVLSSIQS
ncbi:membrane protein [Leuconostoc litchii]|uniref:DUF2798 domain-containing protein n=1 Tax=Leuconostoc litchii TaxID=1981069 RepID=A0A6P2CL92_9LACO|nr:DUF2798 domain-containing protein [Leuconostoc litchii]TYC46750.1 DUF2798 domain-containing protein [Leuconostoc litchii]GMA70632.1 membrane protein [Leuconostoc litchii]